jgi:hypothetical protein
VGSISHRTLRQVGSGRLSALGDQQSASECVRRTLPSVFGRPLFGVKQTCCSITFDLRARCPLSRQEPTSPGPASDQLLTPNGPDAV